MPEPTKTSETTETTETSGARAAASGDSTHLIQALLEQEQLEVVSPAPELQISPGQLLMVDCRVSRPEQVQGWYVSKPKSTPFLLLSPEKEHLSAMASVCKLTATERQYAVLYEPAEGDRISVTALGYMITAKDDKPGDDIEPSAESKSTAYFMEAVRRSYEGAIQISIIYPEDPPPQLICAFPVGQLRFANSILFSTNWGDLRGGYVHNATDTNFVSTYIPYLFLQQEENGTENSQIMIIATGWDIVAGDLYADFLQERGNALCNMAGTLEPDPYTSSFLPSPAPNNISPASGSGSFDANISEAINFYDNGWQMYIFSAGASYEIEDWAVSSICNGTALGAAFYATQPTNCYSYPSGNAGFYDNDSKIYDLSPASRSGGTLNFATVSSWQTKTNELVSDFLTVYSTWDAVVYRWFVDQEVRGDKGYIFSSEYGLKHSFSIDFSTIQPPG